MHTLLGMKVEEPSPIRWSIFRLLDHPFVIEPEGRWLFDAMMCDLAAAIHVMTEDPDTILKQIFEGTFADHVIAIASQIEPADVPVICETLLALFGQPPLGATAIPST